MDECPLCGAPVAAPRLFHHVAEEHDWSQVTGGLCYFRRDDHAPYFWICWCGDRRTPTSMLSHWGCEGGLAAHLLEIALGQRD